MMEGGLGKSNKDHKNSVINKITKNNTDINLIIFLLIIKNIEKINKVSLFVRKIKISTRGKKKDVL